LAYLLKTQLHGQELREGRGLLPLLVLRTGIGRLAMLSLGLTDIRDLYRSDIDWLRKTRILR